MELSVVTPEGSYFSGEIESLTAVAHDGGIGILNGHAPLVTELGSGLMIAITTEGEEKIVLSGGYLQVLNNKITVLATYACKAVDIDAEQAQKDLDAARELKAFNEEDMKSRLEAIARAKALLSNAE
jgi:F-type H+-transporting ATPase subunit epsilon